MRRSGQRDQDLVARADEAGCNDNGHDPGLTNKLTIGVAGERCRHESLLEAVELGAGVAKPSDLNDGIGPDMKTSASRELEQGDATSGDVLAHKPWRDPETRGSELVMKFGVDQMNLPEVGLTGVTRDARAMLDRRAHVHITIYAETVEKPDRRL